MALSSTDATPSTISPSHGITSRACTMTWSPTRSVVAGTTRIPRCSFGSSSFFAITPPRVRRSASAWALPRPSAIASAKFANSSVNHSHTAMAQMNPAGSSPGRNSAAIPSPVVNTLPTNTVNMTGFRRWCRGSSFRAESRSARTRMSRSSHARGVAVLIVPPR